LDPKCDQPAGEPACAIQTFGIAITAAVKVDKRLGAILVSRRHEHGRQRQRRYILCPRRRMIEMVLPDPALALHGGTLCQGAPHCNSDRQNVTASPWEAAKRYQANRQKGPAAISPPAVAAAG